MARKRIPLDDHLQRIIAQRLAYMYFYHLKVIEIARKKKEKLYMGLYVATWQSFVKGFDEFLNSNTLKDFVITHAEIDETDGPYESLCEKEEVGDKCIAEYVLGGLFIESCLAHKELGNDLVDAITQDVACRLYTLIKKDVVKIYKRKESAQ